MRSFTFDMKELFYTLQGQGYMENACITGKSFHGWHRPPDMHAGNTPLWSIPDSQRRAPEWLMDWNAKFKMEHK